MKRHLNFAVCFIATLSAVGTFAPITSAQTSASGAPVAYIYVSSPSNKDVKAFAAASNGKLTAVAGSPFPVGYAESMTANAKYLFTTDSVFIYTYSVAPDGAIKQVASINAQQFNPDPNYGGPGWLFLDRSGATVYDTDFYCCGTNDAFQFFSTDNATGQLNYLGVTTATWDYWVPLTFIGNNLFAYASECSEYSSIFGFQRNDDGTLSALNINPSVPTPPKGYSYCPNQMVADSANHLAMALTPQKGYQASESAPPPQLATYTADSSGNITTKSTRFNMPKTAIPLITDIAMSPSGKLLAVAGVNGLQVFHFNGSKPLTHYTGLLIKNQIDLLSWDNGNHLYALSQTAGKLFVFTVTQNSVSQAPGSPYKISKPGDIAVLPKT